MARYNRVNIDGKQITETRLMGAAIKAGSVVVIGSADTFVLATDPVAQNYVLDAAFSQGLGINDVIPVGDSGQAEYINPSREFAARAAVGAYKKDQALTVVNGEFKTAGEEDVVIAFAQENYTTTADSNLLRVRIK